MPCWRRPSSSLAWAAAPAEAGRRQMRAPASSSTSGVRRDRSSFIADADGSNPRKLVAGSQHRLQRFVLRRRRVGRVHVRAPRIRRHLPGPDDRDGTRTADRRSGFDDQAALSPDGSSVAFVSTRDGGSADIHILDMKTRQSPEPHELAGRRLSAELVAGWTDDRLLVRSRNEPSSPRRGTWEHVQAASVYVLRADGQGLPQAVARRSARRIAEVVAGREAGRVLRGRRGRHVQRPQLPTCSTKSSRESCRWTSRQGAAHEHASGRGLKLSPQYLAPDRIAYLVKRDRRRRLAFSSGETGTRRGHRQPGLVARTGNRLVYHSGWITTIPAPRTPGQVLAGRDPRFELLFASGFPAVSPDGRQLVVSERTGRGNPDDRTALAVWQTRREESEADLSRRTVGHGTAVVVRRGRIVFGAGSYFLDRVKPARQVHDGRGRMAGGARRSTRLREMPGFPAGRPTERMSSIASGATPPAACGS